MSDELNRADHDHKGKPDCKVAQEKFWENSIKNLSLEVDRKTIKKIREIMKSLGWCARG